MGRLGFGLSALALIVSAPVAANPATATEDTTKNPDERVICRKEESIGSRLAAKRICLTAKEWKERAALNREETERAQQSAGTRPST